MKKDYYKTLGVPKDASEKDIKKAFRSMAMKYHPDKNDDPGSEVKFKEAGEAYDVLGNPEKKAKYDRFGSTGFDQHQGHGGGGFRDIFESFGDVFGGSFGFGRSQRGSRNGADIKHTVVVSLSNIVKGGTITIDSSKSVDCTKCGGNGCAIGTSPEVCGSCNGGGFVSQSNGYMKIQTSCPGCGGTGAIITKKCKKCKGRGVENRNEKVKVSIPRGIETGTTLRLAGRGGVRRGDSSPGDLYIKVIVEEHELFRRRGCDLVYDMSIDFITASIGGSVVVPTIHGKCRIDIPPGTQYGDLIRAKKKGCPVLNHNENVGDQINRVAISTPIDLSTKEAELLKEFRSLRRKTVTSGKHSN
jgi:molecular chaperone DnaJ